MPKDISILCGPRIQQNWRISLCHLQWKIVLPVQCASENTRSLVNEFATGNEHTMVLTKRSNAESMIAR